MLLREVTLDDVAEVTGGAVVDGRAMVGASGEEIFAFVSTDTRTLQPGALFVALRGDTFDGHQYLAEAAEKGAVAFLVDEEAKRGVHQMLHDAALPYVVVGDTLRALGDLARFVRDAFSGPVVGVTGSVGKTTTKDLIAQVLSPAYLVHKSAGNFNNEVGVPQTVLGLKAAHTALVVEMGMRGPGEIARLAEIAAPTAGVITNIGLSHIERLGSREAIARAKGELFDLLPGDGLAVYPAQDEFAHALRNRFKGGNALSCAVDAPADVTATDLVRHENGWRFTAQTPWGREKCFVPSPGRFNVLNALFAFAVGRHLNVSLDRMARALHRWVPPAGRLETVRTIGNVTILADAYNAAPDSMAGALQTLAHTPGAVRRVAVLGDMRELGDFGPEAHREVGKQVVELSLDLLVLVGPFAALIGEGALAAGLPGTRIVHFATTEEAAGAAPLLVRAGDVVLVKGSRALGLEQVTRVLQSGSAISPESAVA